MEQFSGKVLGIENYFVQGNLEAHVIRVGIENSFSFTPGQYLMVSEDGFKLKADPTQLKWSPYSICSSPLEKDLLEFVYTIKYTGGFTQHLAENLKIGGKLNFKGPYGKFILEENGREKIFVSTGAGIAPIMSMLRTLERTGVTSTLFYGFRTGAHFLYRKELEALAEKKKIRLFTTVSREDPSWKGNKGYVQSLLEKSVFSPERQEIYLCGNPEMVRDVRSFFLNKGFLENQVKIEQW